MNTCNGERSVLLLLVPNQERHFADLDNVGVVEFLLGS
jgi:hypothetical protein